jgi:protein SCO1/2
VTFRQEDSILKKIILVLSVLITFLNAGPLGIEEKLGQTVPLDLTFLNENSEHVTLKKLMDGKPTILTLNYFKCAGICSPQLNDLAKTLGKLDLAENTDYKVITVSFAENETPALAAAKRKNHIESIGREYVADAWHFVVGENNSSGKLANSVGFRYQKTVSVTGQTDYIHSASLIVLSPEGKVTRYLYGITQAPIDLKMAIFEASNGTVRPTIAKPLLFCFSYDPQAKKYVFIWEKVAGIVMLVMVFGFFLYLVKLGRKEDDREIVEHNQKKES